MTRRLEVMEQVVTCTACSLHESCNGPVAFTGPNPCSVAIIGEAPGAQEDKEGRPFIGPAGDLLRSHLRELEIDPDGCFIMNTVSCYPNGTPSPQSIAACRPNKIAQLEMADPTWVLLLGRVALSAVRSGPKISAARGRPFRPGGDTGPVFFAAYHPAAALRNGEFARGMAEDLRTFAKMVGNGIEGWQKFILESCWECGSDEVCWYDPDSLMWCEKHAPPAYHDLMAELEAERKVLRDGLMPAPTQDEAMQMCMEAFPGATEELSESSSVPEAVGPANYAPAVSLARDGWARHDNPQTSHDTAQWMTVEHVTNLQWAVLWAHWKLDACTEAEVRTYLNEQKIKTGNIDNVRRRRGEITKGLRADGTERPDWIVIDPSAGRGPTLDGQRLGASRYRCTDEGSRMAATIDPLDLRRILPLEEAP